MDAEQIVRALAAADPLAFDSQEDRTCGLCGVSSGPLGDRWPNLSDPAAHAPTCPWRLAQEWQDHIWIEVTDPGSLPDRVWMCNRHPGELRREPQ